ncbi:MAG: hypothetical protein MJ224_02660 [archaeon]|nr:hypothetical protein [archaeon]
MRREIYDWTYRIACEPFYIGFWFHDYFDRSELKVKQALIALLKKYNANWETKISPVFKNEETLNLFFDELIKNFDLIDNHHFVCKSELNPGIF